MGKENIIMEIRKATAEDFDIVFDFIEKLSTPSASPLQIAQFVFE